MTARRAARMLLIGLSCMALASCGDKEVSKRKHSDNDAASDQAPIEDEIREEEIDESVLVTPDGTPRLVPTDKGPDLRFAVIPTEWVSPPELGEREAAVGLPDETGAFLFMVSLRKARFRGTFEHLRAILVETATAMEGMQPGVMTHRRTKAFGLSNCELITGVMETTAPGGRFPVGHVMRSRTWACIDDGLLYQASSLEMAEPDKVIAQDILTLVNRAEIVPEQ